MKDVGTFEPILEDESGVVTDMAHKELIHYGVARRSGRYPWGSGDSPYQHSGDFLSGVESLKKQKIKYTDEDGKVWTGENAIAKSLGMTSTEYRDAKSIAKDERRLLDVQSAKDLRDKGLSTTEIGKQMGKPESTIRSLLNEDSEKRSKEARVTADFIKKMIDEKGMVDVGVGVERDLGVSKEKLRQALYMLEMEGYELYGGGVSQVQNPGNQTNLKVICPPGTEHKDIFKYEINSVKDYDQMLTEDGSKVRPSFVYPASLDPKRITVRYAEDGGLERDGTIELRRGVEDVSLGESNYAQVRILAGGTHYIKGMAVYGDDKDFPDGVDVIFNTNKTKDIPAFGPKDNTVLKPIKKDQDNPFGSAIKEHGGQSYYIDKDGKEKLRVINKRADEGDWNEWKDKLPSQFLAKQSLDLVKKQLSLAEKDKVAEFEDILSLNNPTVKKKLLQSFSDDCDSAAVHLYAAALPRQKYQVILPVNSLKDNEAYAPNFEDGEKIALIRYPHGGTFEIPIVTVNNKHKPAQKMFGKNPSDLIGINSKVAERLSGADFDGDTVMAVPCNSPTSKVKITNSNPLKGLEGFDPKMEYPYREGMKLMKNTQTEMGKISNLITDMTIKGANEKDLAKAVRHSMTVIDAEKHRLDWKRSEIENDIATLKKTWQGRIDPETGKERTGASTLLSRAKSQVSVDKRQGSPHIDEKTGEITWKTADDLYYDVTKTNKKTGVTTTVTKKRTQQSTQMAETKDARTLSSGHPVEEAYAAYANKMKALANDARKTMVNTGKIAYSASAKASYETEVKSLMSQLNIALKNAPRERQAQLMANRVVAAKKQDNPGLTPSDLKKIGQQELTSARVRVGAKRNPIKISEREWAAIQAGAISENVLTKILNNADMDVLRQLATPKNNKSLSTGQIAKIKSMQASGYTNAEIAKSLGKSASTISKYLKGGD